MNDLNSVIFEGKVSDIKEPCEVDGNIMVQFVITGKRFFRHKKQSGYKETPVKIQVFGRLAESCGANLKDEALVRVVGRLDIEDREAIIVGEHIEYKRSPVQGGMHD